MILASTSDEEESVVALFGIAVTGGSGLNGAGLHIEQAAQVRIGNCIITQNRYGIRLVDTARAAIESSLFLQNHRHGVRMEDGSHTTIHSSTIQANRWHGIVIQGSAQATVIDSGIEGNGRCGVDMEDFSQASILRSAIVGNNHGILTGGRSQTILDQTLIAANIGSGILMLGASQVSVQISTITGNGKHGIAASRHSRLIASGSTISRNEEAGVHMEEAALVEMVNMVVSENRGDGLLLVGSTTSVVRSSSVEGNAQHGIVVAGRVEATIQDSTIKDNGASGIYAVYALKLDLLGNRVIENAEYGMRARGGRIAGSRNVIPGPGEEAENRGGALVPADLAFLTTDEGGERDWLVSTWMRFIALGVEEMEPARARDLMNEIVDRLKRRLEQTGLLDVEVQLEGRDRVSVYIPGAYDPEEVRFLISSTGTLEFCKVLDTATTPDDLVRTEPTQDIVPLHDGSEYYLVDRQPLLTGEAVDSAEARMSTDLRYPWAYIALRFNQAGAERFVEVLEELTVGDRLAIVLDGVVYSAPLISEYIKQAAEKGWRAVQHDTRITGAFTFDEAQLLAVVLTAALPADLMLLEEGHLE